MRPCMSGTADCADSDSRLLRTLHTDRHCIHSQITIDGKAIRAQRAAKVYFALHKPKGYICSNAPSANAQHTPRLAVDLLSDWVQQQHSSNTQANALPTRLFTVGRLDVQSTGLILVTNDGETANSQKHCIASQPHLGGGFPCCFMQMPGSHTASAVPV